MSGPAVSVGSEGGVDRHAGRRRGWPPIWIRLTRQGEARSLNRWSLCLAAFAAVAVAAGVLVIPALAASGDGSVSVSVGVVPPAVKSVSVSPGSTTYTGCK